MISTTVANICKEDPSSEIKSPFSHIVLICDSDLSNTELVDKSWFMIFFRKLIEQVQRIPYSIYNNTINGRLKDKWSVSFIPSPWPNGSDLAA